MIIQLRHLSLLLLLFTGLGLTVGNGSAAATPQGQPAILVLGDSISAAYGMSLQEGWVHLLQQRLRKSHPGYRVVNASISGETSGGAASRLPTLLARHRPAIVIIELGGNDGLRGYPVKRLQTQLVQMARQSAATGARVMIVAMEIPPNYGRRYTRQFRKSFALAADSTGSTLVPFLLEGVAMNPGLMQADSIHPTVEAQPLLLDNVWPYLEPLLKSLPAPLLESPD